MDDVMTRARARYGPEYNINPDLWFVDDDHCGARHYLTGNPHTHAGRFAVYCDAHDLALAASKWEMTGEASPAARAWVDGFLAGNEPGPEDLAGPDIHDLDDTDERWEQWQAAVREFSRTGLNRWPRWWTPEPLPAADLTAGSWCLRGCQVWRWADRTWAYARPQPDLDWLYLSGSLCAGREEHDPVALAPDDPREVCRDCCFLEPD